jgi:hypothetical protein
MLAVGGGLLYAATRPASPALPVRAAGAASSTAPHRPATSMPFGGPATPDPAVRDGRLEIPLVDSIELLPGCHH